MAYIPTEKLTGQPLSDVSTVQMHPLGTTIKAIDPAGGGPEGEFVYVKGVAACALGSLVKLESDGSISLSGARTKGRVGVAMSVLDAATKFGWVQIKGRAVVKYTGATADKAQAFLHATAGTVSNAAVAGDAVISATFKGAAADPGVGLAYLDIDRPACADFDNA